MNPWKTIASLPARLGRVSGVTTLLAGIFGWPCACSTSNTPRGWSNLKEVFNQQAFFAVLTLGAGVLILSGGIDLSMGSGEVGLAGVAFGVLMTEGVPPYQSAGIVLGMGLLIGLTHGLLVTRLKLQAFLVTLCGLFVYRGLASASCLPNSGPACGEPSRDMPISPGNWTP